MADEEAVLPVQRDLMGYIFEQRRRERKYPLDLDSMTNGYGTAACAGGRTDRPRLSMTCRIGISLCAQE